MRKLFIGLLACFIGYLASAQSIPSPRAFLGYEVGQKFTPHHQLIQYFEALKQAAPQQMTMERYGYTNEGRPLVVCYISTPANMANLDAIRQNNLRLARGEKVEAGGSTPAIVWLSYNVHGNEASSSEACMLTVYDLLTNAASKAWLNNTVVVVDPCLNPDGRDRYVNWYNGMVGLTMNVDPQSREHSEPWPGGRSNHYNFDLNRDWAWQSQLETQQRMKKYQQWLPQIHVDYHEQGYNEPYYFAPAAEPYHEVITAWQRSFQTQLGRNHARYFDENGWLYFTKERFDLLYPSYGDTWPMYNGAVGMTYEQGGIRAGLGIINSDGDTLTLRDRVMHHHTTALSTVEMASKNATALVTNFASYFDEARRNGVGEYKTFVVKAKGQQHKLQPLFDLLSQNQIAYGINGTGTATGFNYFTAKEESFSIEPGDVLISTKQTAGNLAKVLFEPLSKLSDSATYDITAWSIPYAYGLTSYAVKNALLVDVTPKSAATPKQPEAVTAAYGFVVPWQNMGAARFLANVLAAGVKVRVSEKSFELDGKSYAPGALIMIKTSNRQFANFEKLIQEMAVRHGVMAEVLRGGFVDKGADFGSPDVNVLKAPRVGVFTGEQSSSLAAGEVWFFMDADLKYPATLINTTDAGRIDFRRYDVLVVPDGNYRNLLQKDGELRKWVEQGGKLIAMENAVQQMASAGWGLSLKPEASDKNSDTYADVKRFENRERNALAFNNPGSIFKVDLDNSHPLGWGYPEYYYTLKSDDNVYEFLKSGWNVGVLKKQSRVAGFVGSKSKDRYQDAVLFGQFPVGRGSVVFLADDVLFRNFWQNGKLMFANALFMTP
ncbi:MAG: zinc carboxypeptidase [Bacteroidetes bacterium]|nr:MAG: zinc carboxypeptidase [Bacteroidota bacterium]